MRKRFLLFVLLTVALLVFSACDSGLRYSKMEIVSLPEKLVYDTTDTALDFSGGAVRLTTIDGHAETKEMSAYTYQTRQIAKAVDVGRYIFSDVNFSIPGEYTVTIFQTDGVMCSYTITVRK